jgi:DNA polymerase III delta prime subunit
MRDVSMTAFGGAPRVIVLSDAHTLTPEAGNALLKILEEPPEGVTFILLVPTVARIMPTLRSRARLVSINQTSPTPVKRAEAFIRTPIAGRLAMIAGLDGRLDQLELARELLVCAQELKLLVFAQWLLPSFVAVEKSGNARLLLEASALRLGDVIDV